jgi:hypothetical protein
MITQYLRIIIIVVLILIILIIKIIIGKYDYINSTIDFNNYNYKYNLSTNNSNYIINLYSNNHLGDCVYDSFYFNNIQNFIEEENIIINYFIKKEYHKQIREFILSNNIILHNYDKIGLNLSITNLNYWNNMYVNSVIDNIFNYSKLIYDKHYIKFYNETSSKLNIPIKMNNFIYRNKNLITTYDNLDNKYKDIDILIINSRPLSGQYNFDKKTWDDIIINLDSKYKIVTTLNVNNNIQCTMSDNLSLFQIAAISIKSKLIIGINTGPMAGIFNEYTLNNCKKIYLLDNKVTYSYPIIDNIKDISEINFDEINNLIKNNL